MKMSNIEKKREDKRKIFKTINSANWTNKITFLQTTNFCIRPRQNFRFHLRGLNRKTKRDKETILFRKGKKKEILD